ncbi:MAG TPA: DUF4255 domain-containing protein [Vicinamibacterales bacterium]|jgi:hypothetical protein|nr:DUF4255 domain-containing protein [Vicinamibacterales bacterium]
MPLGLLDLSIVTDRLVKHLNDCAAASRLWDEEPTDPEGTPPDATPTERFTINFTGLAPDVTRGMDDCQVSLYLFHVTRDKFNSNTFPLGGRARTIPEQPLALTLYYLLSASAPNSYIHEQQAMSVALKCLHDFPIVRAKVPIDQRTEEFTLTMEPESVDDIARLWQAMATPLRLGAVYRASVVFLEPESVEPPQTKLVLRPHVEAITIHGGPHANVSAATVTSAGLATITGTGFVAGSVDVQIGGFVFQPRTAAGPPAPGEFRIVNSTTIELQFPANAPMPLTGRYLLRMRTGREQPAAEIWLDVP